MKFKSLNLIVASILLAVFLISFASSLTLSPSPSSLNTFTKEGHSQTITVTSDVTANFSASSLSSFNVEALSPENNANSVQYNITLRDEIGSGSETLVISAKDSSNSSTVNSTSITLNYESSFCEYGSFVIDKDGDEKSNGNLDFSVEITNEGQGEDDEWVGLDTIKVEVTLENNFDEDRDDSPDFDNTQFELGLYDEEGNNVVDELIWVSDDDEKSDDADLDAEEELTYIFEFKVDPELDEGDYNLVIKAYNDESGNQNNNSESFCLDYSDDLEDFGNSKYFADIKINQEGDEDKMVIVDVDSLPRPIQVNCDDSVSIIVDVWNIGDKTFEDYVLVNLYNSKLGIDVYKVIDDNKFKSGDNEELIFSFDLPKDIEEGQYTLQFRTYYDYDEDEGDKMDWTAYDEKSDDTFDAYLKVIGDCSTAKVAVSAALEEGTETGYSGESLKVKATVLNTGSRQTDYLVSTSSYSEWANSASVSENSFSLEAGESKDIWVTLDVKENVEGEKPFTLDVSSGNKLIASQPVSVPIEKKSRLSITGFAINKDNWHIWGIGLLNLILVFVIIIVAVRIARRR